jgi:phenylacetate-CoA ligase
VISEIPRSNVAGILWPAIPDSQGALSLALQQQLAESERWSAEELRGQQFRQLGLLLDHAFDHCPFYRDRLEAAGWRPGLTLDDEIWSRIPVLRRQDVQRLGQSMVSANPPASHGRRHVVQTSGSTGAPIKVVKTRLDNVFWEAITLRDHLWHRRKLGAKLAAIRHAPAKGSGSPEGSVTPHWGRSAQRAYETGPAALLDIVHPVEVQAEWLKRADPDYLLSFPTNIHALARYCLNKGLRYPKLREIMTISEALSPETRAIAREAFGVKICDLYTSRETGYMALQCPAHEHHHVQSEVNFLEVTDNAGQPCRTGDVGQVVTTPLHSFAMPLIRYAIGDYAELDEPCSCGRTLPVLRRILGRVRNMLVLPDGRRRFPYLQSPFTVFSQIAAIENFQVVQLSHEDIEVRLVTRRPLTAEEEAGLRANLLACLGLPARLRLSYHDALPRSAGGKFEDFRSEID